MIRKSSLYQRSMIIMAVFVMLLNVLAVCPRKVLAEGGVSVSTDYMSMNINDERTFRIKADNCVANIDITSSDEKIAKPSFDSVWLDNESVLVTVYAHKAGNCRITINITDAATYDEQHFTAQYHIDVEVKKDLLPQEVLFPYASIESGDVSEGTKLALYCDTPDSVIRYSINGSDFQEYADAIELGKKKADEEQKITVNAYATKEGNYTDSEMVEYVYHIIESEEDYGSITEEDQQIYDDPSEIPDGFWIAGIRDFDYTGKALTQDDFRVYYGTTLLVFKTDYSVSYKNNTNAGTATMTVSGKGNYAGSLSVPFIIHPISIDPVISLNDVYTYKMSGVSISPKVTNNGKTIKNKTDYTYTIRNGKGEIVSKLNEAGYFTVSFTGTGNYSFSKEVTVRMIENNQKLVSNLAISFPSSSNFDYTYDGKEKCPPLTIKDGKIDLSEHISEFFDVSYENNINAGTASVTVAAKENNADYAGSTVKTFNIKGISISKASISGFVSSYPYSEEAIEQDLILNYNGEKLLEGKDYTISYSNNRDVGTATMIINGEGIYSGTIKKTFKINGVALSKVSVSGIENKSYTGKEVLQDSLVLTYDGKSLVEGSDYRLEYKNNIKAGSASLKIIGMGGYTGNVNKSFKIAQTELTDKRIQVSMDGSYEYVKGGVKPGPVITCGTYTLVNGVDYKLSYKNNGKINDNSNSKNITSVVITGKGNYKGTLTRNFKITTKQINQLEILAKDCAAGLNKTNVTITDVNGKNLSVLTDYTITKCVYNENVKLANGTQRYVGESVFFADIIPANTVLKVTIKGKGSYTGTVTALYKTYKKSISSVTATIAAQEYTGEPITLSKNDIVLKSNGTIVSSSQYDIVSYKNNIKKGNATVTIKGKGDYYGGTKDIRFTIKNKNMSCTLTFDGNGATSGSMKDQTISGNTAIKSNSFKKTGYVFVGWSYQKNGPVVYSDKDMFNYDKSCYGNTVRLYAIWQAQ